MFLKDLTSGVIPILIKVLVLVVVVLTGVCRSVSSRSKNKRYKPQAPEACGFIVLRAKPPFLKETGGFFSFGWFNN